MKILFDFINYSGGAPKSQLGHMKLMAKEGHEVIATVGSDYEKISSLIPDIKIIKTNNFDIKKPLNALINLYNWIKIVRKYRPDIIHTNRTTQYKFLSVVSELTATPIAIVQPGGKVKIANVKPINNKKAIVYSIENRESLIKAGFKKENIKVISNRIEIEKFKSVDNSRQDKVKILISGNFKETTFRGVLSLLDQIQNINCLNNINCEINIVGKDTSKNNKYLSKILGKINETNEILKPSSSVDYLGWIDDIQRFEQTHDICFGKGRSVLQCAMKGKISFVMSEDGNVIRISEETLSNLYKYNFTGRGAYRNDIEDLYDLLRYEKIRSGFIKEANNVEGAISKLYDIKYAKEKLLKFYNSITKYNNNIRNKNAFYRCCIASILLVKIYIYKLIYFNKNI